MPIRGAREQKGGKVISYLSHLTGWEQAVFMICSKSFYHQNDQPNLAESDATLPPVVPAFPGLYVCGSSYECVFKFRNV